MVREVGEERSAMNDELKDVPLTADSAKTIEAPTPNPFEGLSLDGIAAAYAEMTKSLRENLNKAEAKKAEAWKIYEAANAEFTQEEGWYLDDVEVLEDKRNDAVIALLEKMGLRDVLKIESPQESRAPRATANGNGNRLNEGSLNLWLQSIGAVDEDHAVMANAIRKEFNLSDGYEVGKAVRNMATVKTNGVTRAGCRYYAVVPKGDIAFALDDEPQTPTATKELQTV